MNKIKSVIAICAGMVLAYIVIIVTGPPVREIIGMGKDVVDANPNIESYWGLSSFYGFAPLLLYLAPIIIGGILLVIVLKSQDN
jgi:hypothetical protein